MASQTLTVAYVADFTLTFPLTAGQATTTSSNGSWYPLGVAQGSYTSFQVPNGLKYSVLNIKLLSALTTDLLLSYYYNGTLQQTAIDVNYFAANLQNPARLQSSITADVHDTILFIAYPTTTVTTAADEVIILNILVEPSTK